MSYIYLKIYMYIHKRICLQAKYKKNQIPIYLHLYCDIILIYWSSSYMNDDVYLKSYDVDDEEAWFLKWFYKLAFITIYMLYNITLYAFILVEIQSMDGLDELLMMYRLIFNFLLNQLIGNSIEISVFVTIYIVGYMIYLLNQLVRYEWWWLHTQGNQINTIAKYWTHNWEVVSSTLTLPLNKVIKFCFYLGSLGIELLLKGSIQLYTKPSTFTIFLQKKVWKKLTNMDGWRWRFNVYFL